MKTKREYPDRPLVGVGAIVLKENNLLLIRRGHPPAEGAWTFPGGLIEIGESAADAIRREVMEECHISIEPIDLAGIFEPVVTDGNGRIKYHYVVLDFLARYISGNLKAASDAWEARWVPLEQVAAYPLSEDAQRLLDRAREITLRGPTECCPPFKTSTSRLDK